MDFPIENGGSFHSYVKLPEGSFQHLPALIRRFFLMTGDCFQRNLNSVLQLDRCKRSLNACRGMHPMFSLFSWASLWSFTIYFPPFPSEMTTAQVSVHTAQPAAGLKLLSQGAWQISRWAKSEKVRAKDAHMVVACGFQSMGVPLNHPFYNSRYFKCPSSIQQKMGIPAMQ